MQFTQRASFAVTAALTFAVGACATSGGNNSGMGGGPVSAAVAEMQWNGSLQPVGGTNVRGTATLSPGGSSSEATANISITGSTSGTSHPWQLHRGSCGNDLGILGTPASYPALGTGADGTARVMVGLPFAMPTSGRYFVTIYHSPQNMTPVACGNLTLGTR